MKGIKYMNQSQWTSDPIFQNISQEKLDFLNNIVQKGSSLTQKEMLPFLLSLSKQSKASNISFSPTEIQLIVTALKKYATPEDLEKIEKVSSSHFQ